MVAARGGIEPMKQSEQHARGIVGAAVARLEDPPLVRGRGLFAADVSFPRQLHMRVVRSPLAHARIKRVDAADALAAPGVVAVWTGEDLADISPIDFRDDRVEKLVPHRQPLLARGRVRYVGEPVAVVFADDPYRGGGRRRAGDRSTLDELPPVMSADDDPVEIDGLSTEPMIIEKGYGDLAAAFRAAHAVVEVDVSIGRHSAVPLETRGAIARYDAARDMLELHGAAKVPHRNREQLAKILNRPLSSIHLFEGHVGGGFGVRGELYPEDVLVCLAALRLGRPVKWIEDRHEHFVAANHSRQQRHKLRAAVDKDGRILGIEDEFVHDQGAYVRTHGARVVDLTAGMLPGPYHVPAYRAAGHYRLTNKTPAATYRSPGRYESTFARERLMDAIAQQLGIDRIEVRRRNLIDKSRDAVRAPAHRARRRGGLRFRRLCRPARQGAARDSTGTPCKRNSPRAAATASWSAPGLRCSSRRAGSARPTACNISVDPTGAVEVVTGGSSLGQGFETVMAQICAGALGVDYRRIRVVHGQTDRIEHGIGAHATRATVMTGSATHVAALQAARAGARHRLAAAADARRRADHRRRPRDAQGRAVGPVDRARRDRAAARARLEVLERRQSRADVGRLAPHRAHDLPLRRPRRGRAGRPRHRRAHGRALSDRL